MRVLIACEFSGIVRDAFKEKGHDAWSCDLLPTELPGNHIQDDVLKHLDEGWDLMIAHPPCQFLSFAGNGHLKQPGRLEKRAAAFEFFMAFAKCGIPRICIENPIGYPVSAYRKPDQIIDPYYFGDPFKKRTCLWLIGLKPLIWTEADELFWKRTAVPRPKPDWVHLRKPSKNFKGTELKARYFTDSTTGKDRQKTRSRTFPGIAKAMADQWG